MKVKAAVTAGTHASTVGSIAAASLTTVSAALDTTGLEQDGATGNYYVKVGTNTAKVNITFTTVSGSPVTIGSTDLAVGLTGTGTFTAVPNLVVKEATKTLTNGDVIPVTFSVAGNVTDVVTLTFTLADKT